MLGAPSGIPLSPSPPHSGDEDDLHPPIAHLVNGLVTPDRTPSMSSSFGDTSILDPPGPSSKGQAILTSASTSRSRRQSSTFDGSSKAAKKKIAQLEDFQLIKVLGKGCAGRVLLVKHTRTNAVRAMKAVSKRSVLTYDELNHTLTEQSILRRFATEEPHNQFVTRLHHTFTDRENFYFVMDFYPGGDLATQMEIHGVLGDHRTRFYAADITQGLIDLHQHGIIVRDLKPENVLLNGQGHAVLADFGLSKEFSYRGEPKPIHVVTYAGQPELPSWAGAGAGSLRTLASGQKKLMIDKAYSFVGTTEYLSPEVVRRSEYSYAVDWWALGCIVLEGLVGRVPFRAKDDDPPMVLYDMILFDPWDDLFRLPKWANHMPDPVTYSFIDALLQKDPMWRLTEPSIQQHAYFSLLDWDTVRRGEYHDPYGLQLHPTAEYNTHYFPKLCLEEDPSVDMSNHDVRDYNERKRTPLNDNQLYALEQAKHKPELESFAWSREEEEYETYTESEGEGSILEQEEVDTDMTHDILEKVEESPIIRTVRIVMTDDVQGGGAVVEAEQRSLQKEWMGQEENETAHPPVDVGLGNSIESDPLHVMPEDTAHDLAHEIQEAFGGPTPAVIPSVTSADSLPTLANGRVPQVRSDGSPEPNSNESGSLDPAPGVTPDVLLAATASTPSPARSPAEHSTESTTPDDATPQALSPPLPLPLPAHIREQASPPLSSHTAGTAPVPIPLRPKPVCQLSHDLDLPQDLPSSGLSVSEVISVASQHPGSPTRIVRRHAQLQSIDTIPIARLSVELHGTITHIDDEDWEELVPEGPDASAPNGHGGSNMNGHSIFGVRGLGGVLRRKPSTLVGSGLRRQTKTSDSSSRDSGSPTKQRPQLFTAKSIENTKRALGKLKTFPKLKGLNQERKTSNSNSHSSLSLSPSPSQVQSHLQLQLESKSNPNVSLQNHSPLTSPPMSGVIDPRAEADNKDGASSTASSMEERPGMGRRHTESGWFDRVRKTKASMGRSMGMGMGSSTPSSLNSGKKARTTQKENRKASTSSLVGSSAEVNGDGGAGAGGGVMGKPATMEIPKLELGEFGGLDWGFDGKSGEWGIK